ncbi:MAG TPA: zinc ribbon domain-containing protein [Candidatus Aphodovivens avistercoris]|nr:zinc ribbon domain-containing protein [Candidatus Aphodovivens avistercoris]
MGLFDNVTAAARRGSAAAERTARKVRLQAQLADLNKRRQGLAAQLGASLYEITRDNEAFRAGREGLYGDIAACDAERDELKAQIARIEAEAAAEAAAVRSFACGVCGARMAESDLFCSGCGASAEEVRAAAHRTAAEADAGAPAGAEAADGPACPFCGAPVGAGDLFCMGCGSQLGGAAEDASGESAGAGAADGTFGAAPEAAGDGKGRE